MEENSILSEIRELISQKFDELKIAQKSFLTVDELASYIGCKVSYIYKLTHNREIPHYKPGGKMIYFNKAEIDEWILSQRVATADEIHAEAHRRNRLV